MVENNGKKNLKTKIKKVNELDEVFSKTIEQWDQLATDIASELDDIVRAIAAANIPDDLPEDYNAQMNVICRAFGGTISKAETLHESISGASTLKPIDELEASVIAAIRAIQSVKVEGCLYPYNRSEIHQALETLFTLANKKTGEESSATNRIKKYVHYKEGVEGFRDRFKTALLKDI